MRIDIEKLKDDVYIIKEAIRIKKEAEDQKELETSIRLLGLSPHWKQ